MEPRLECHEQAPAGWEALCAEQGSLFDSAAWQEVLSRGLGARPLYLVQGDAAAVLNRFRAGPFVLGYLSHPAGGLLRGDTPERLVADVMRQRGAPHLLRLPWSPFTTTDPLPWRSRAVPETAIEKLQSWREETLPAGLRRNIRKSRRAGVEVRDLGPSEATRVHALYRDTLERQGGSARYSLAYFRALLEFGSRDRRLRCLGAWLEGELAAFLVVARHRTAAFYLHGGMLPEKAQAQAPTRLFAEAIHWAREEGCTRFNFMSSPPGQQGLVRYKERWGGITRTHHTYEVARSPWLGITIGLAQNLHDGLAGLRRAIPRRPARPRRPPAG